MIRKEAKVRIGTIVIETGHPGYASKILNTDNHSLSINLDSGEIKKYTFINKDFYILWQPTKDNPDIKIRVK